MIRRNFWGTSILVLALVLAASTPALASNSNKVTLQHDMVLKGTALKAGDYAIRWESQSERATVTLSKEKEVLVTAEGQLIDRGTKYRRAAVMYAESADGTRTIREIRFAGSSQVIVFNE